jgi:von Willebrand factor type A domain
VPFDALFLLLMAFSGQDQPGSSLRSGAQASDERPAAEKAKAKSAAASSASAKKLPGPPPASSGRPTKNAAASHARASVAAADVDVRVRTKAEMDKPKSPFLVAPGGSLDDRYGPDGAVNWNEIPPWRQTSFFGLRAKGQFFVYVVDCSGSMIDDDRMPRATIELRRSVFGLREPQRFEVIFYNSESIPMPGGPIPRSADQQGKEQLRSFLRLIDPDGGTDPRPAVKQALSLRPDAIFLLSDGAFPDGTVGEITRLNKQNIPIHCVDLTGGLAGDHLKRIAEANNGQYASRMGDLQGRP